MTSLSPTCTISPSATVSPASGSACNFSSPVSYAITAQNGSTTKTYTATVIVEPDPNQIITMPSGLSPGSQYRLVFVTSTETYGWAGANGNTGFASVAQYHSFATSSATAVPKLSALGTTWTAIVATRVGGTITTAKTNTGTGSGAGVPFYNLGGLRVANNNADLWDGSLANPINVTELGTAPAAQRNGEFLVWTGMADSAGNGNGDFSLITPSGGYIRAGKPTATDATWASTYGSGDVNAYKSDAMPIYVMSGVLTVPAAPSNTYAAWAAANGAIADPAADSNHNGVPNGIEHFMGATAANPATMPALVNTNGVLTWTLPYDPTAVATYKFQLSDNLSGWADVVPPDARITVLTGSDRVRITLPAGAVRTFCRLVVTPAP